MSLDLDAIERRATAATPGPWKAVPRWADADPAISVAIVDSITTAYPLERQVMITGEQRQADQEFIAAARQDIPALVAEVRRLQFQLAALENELRQSQTDLYLRVGLLSTQLIGQIDATIAARAYKVSTEAWQGGMAAAIEYAREFWSSSWLPKKEGPSNYAEPSVAPSSESSR